MKYVVIIPLLSLLFILAGCADMNDAVVCYQLDPLEKVLKEQIYFEDNKDTVVVAKDETVSSQFVVRSIYQKRIKLLELLSN